jgi:hypothetical protein
MPALFLQGLGRKRICRDSFHYGQREIKQFAGTKYVSHRLSYSGTVVPRFGEQAVDDLREKPIWPVRMNAIARGIKFLHRAPYPAAILHYGHLITCNSLSWNVGDMCNVVEETSPNPRAIARELSSDAPDR